MSSAHEAGHMDKTCVYCTYAWMCLVTFYVEFGELEDDPNRQIHAWVCVYRQLLLEWSESAWYVEMLGRLDVFCIRTSFVHMHLSGKIIPVHTYVLAYMHIYIHTHIHVYIHMHSNICMYIYCIGKRVREPRANQIISCTL